MKAVSSARPSEDIEIEDNFDALLTKLETFHLKRLRMPDIFSQKRAVDTFKELIVEEFTLVEARIKNFNNGEFTSLLSKDSKDQLKMISQSLSSISDVL